jgi:hypothetical protein
MKKIMALNFGEFPFEFICKISPDKRIDGNIHEYMPQSGYNNENNLPLHGYGVGPFCHFKIPGGWESKTGVYLIQIDGAIKYVGECEDLTNRFNMGYGNISPRNCFEGGQPTNCRINNEILKMSKRNVNIELFFHETPNRFEVESKLISSYSPEWNKSGGKSVRITRQKVERAIIQSSPPSATVTSCRDEVLSAANQIVATKGVNEFTVQEVINYLKIRGCIYQDSTIRTHIVSRCCSNAPDHHAVVYRDFDRIGRGTYCVINLVNKQTGED